MNYKAIVAVIVLVIVGAAVLMFTNKNKENQNTQTQTAQGSVSGSLGYPSEGIPAMTTCAQAIGSDKEYCVDTKEGDFKYTVRVPAGKYLVYSKTNFSNMGGYRAFYNTYVLCELKAECVGHEPIIVQVGADQNVENVNPVDWYNNQAVTVSGKNYQYQWFFEKLNDATEFEGTPETKVSVLVNSSSGAKFHSIGSFSGECAQIDVKAVGDDKTAIAAQCWWAGAGKQFAIFTNADNLEVKSRTIAEEDVKSELLKSELIIDLK